MYEVETLTLKSSQCSKGVTRIEGECVKKSEVEARFPRRELDDSVGPRPDAGLASNDNGTRTLASDPIRDVVSPSKLTSLTGIVVEVMRRAEEDSQ
jgi:hypothetical protein